jgi:hypothetical protein
MAQILDLQALSTTRDDCNCFSILSSHFAN